jgi:hypothetical protein
VPRMVTSQVWRRNILNRLRIICSSDPILMLLPDEWPAESVPLAPPERRESHNLMARG